MENINNVSSQEELLKLRNEGKITEGEYKELLSEISKTPAKSFTPETVSPPAGKRGLGIASFVLSITGVILPLTLFIIIYFIIKSQSESQSYTTIVILFFSAIVIEIIAFVLGILSRRTVFGKAGALISGILIILLVLFTLFLTVSIPVKIQESGL